MSKLNRLTNMIILGSIISLALLSCGGSNRLEVAEEDFAFDFMKAQSIVEVLDRAKAENKLVYLDISTSWCLPCKMMKADVYTHQETADFMNANFISYIVDAEKANGPDLATIFNIKAYPTLLFLDTKGRELERKVGATYHRELIATANRALMAKPSQ